MPISEYVKPEGTRRPTHLGWHCFADGGRADVLDVAILLAKEYGLAARVGLDDGRRPASHPISPPRSD